MRKTESNKPMYFSTLEVQNIKCFEERQKLDLKDANGRLSPWTLILGENGVGKTTLLKCLSWMVPVQLPLEKDEKTGIDKEPQLIKIKPFMDDFDNEDAYDQLIRIGSDVKAEIIVTLSNGVKLKGIPKENQNVTISMQFERENGKLEVITPKEDTIEQFNTPNIFAYSASRHLALKNIDNTELKDPIANLFSESGDLYDAEQLLSMLDNASRRQGKKSKAAKLLLKVKEILVDLLPGIKDTRHIIINSPINENGSINSDLVHVQTDDGKVKLFDLSLGYKTMLAWIVDLAVRMLWSRPNHKDPLKGPAVVIIDEVDLHLHPIWQRRIREILTRHFSNTQFICTAHSPFMAQSAELENLCVVNRKDNKVLIQNEPLIIKGWRIGQIATSELFGIPSERGVDNEEAIEERRQLIDKQSLNSKERNRLKELNVQISDLPVAQTEDDRILGQIRKAALLLKEKGIIND